MNPSQSLSSEVDFHACRMSAAFGLNVVPQHIFQRYIMQAADSEGSGRTRQKRKGGMSPSERSTCYQDVSTCRVSSPGPSLSPGAVLHALTSSDGLPHLSGDLISTSLLPPPPPFLPSLPDTSTGSDVHELPCLAGSGQKHEAVHLPRLQRHQRRPCPLGGCRCTSPPNKVRAIIPTALGLAVV